MATKTFSPGKYPLSDHSWDNPANWIGGLPLPGDTAVISGPINGPMGNVYANAEITSLTLNDVKVDLLDGGIDGDNLTLLDSQVIMGGKNTLANYNDEISLKQGLEIDRMSFIVDNNVGTSVLYVVQQGITNDGTIGAETSGAVLNVDIDNLGPPGELGNTGQLIASNGGTLELDNANVNGSGGQIKVTNGGTLILNGITIGATEQVSLGGQDRTTLSIGAFSSVAAPISGFLPTDTIDLLDFKGLVFGQSGTVNPTLTILNPIAFITGGPFIEAISLSGNYAHYGFTLAPDKAGSGTDITVHPLA